MPTYRVVFLEPLGETPVRSISFDGDDAGQALLLAQNHDGPAELWLEDQRVCTLLRSGNCGELWVISNRASKAAEPALTHDAGAGTFMLRPGSDGDSSEDIAMPDQKRHDDPPAKATGDNPSLNSELKAQSETQSQVSPNEYPAEERRQQVGAATGAGGKKTGG